ncbi:energy-coupling factor transport system permease protein [Natranaerovirga hydrolytica]|uniref:Energy-coupling factor transport system permease protein n=1 Tax=Natranaerovirga hydrolytica TaxID=680378 RepID=A0A4R1MZU8_9FIRM|nr:energy-coupling factor transporter transmembrane component T [Natranaerovirga hydrolytica]TCK98725.1 energy-coupling factor transport system permease protein [Natranaerovirga hydrolytica]
MQNVGVKQYFKLDPRTKLLLMFFINVTIFNVSNRYVIVVMTAIPIFLLLVSRKIKASLCWILIYTILMAVNIHFVPTTNGFQSVLLAAINMFFRMMPGFIMGYYLISTTTVSEFLAAMEKIRVPQSIRIPMAVMFRFFPTISEESKAISSAMQMRGITFASRRTLKNPMVMIEYRMIPLLMSIVKIGEELSAASLTRGLGNSVKRTNICKIGFHLQDMVLLLLASITFIGFFIY